MGNLRAQARQDRPLPTISVAPYIARLRLTRFRSHIALDLPCGPGAILLTGENGMGKTNILEAVSMLTSGRGLRGGGLEDMLHSGSTDGWVVLADIDGPTGPMRAAIHWEPGGDGRRLRIDGAPVRGLEKLTRALPQLWLTPAMDRLFLDGAGGRRKFLDRFAQTLDGGLAGHLNRFEKAMRERNRLLQTPQTPFAGNAWLDGLEETMALEGTAIAAARLVALDALAAGLLQMPENAFPRAGVALEGSLEAIMREGCAAVEVEDAYRARLRDARGLDASAGRTLEGPHRSDLKVWHETKDMPAAQCSTGEQKALLVGLILAQARSVAARIGDVPVLLLDEVAAHLDARRRAALADILTDLGGQSWITGTDAQIFSAFMPDGRFLHLDAGGVLADSNDATAPLTPNPN